MPQVTPLPRAPGAAADAGSAGPIITVESLGKTYRVADKQPGLAGTVRHFVRRRTREVQAVREVSFQIQPGEMVGFLGANGAGKTTTLKMLCGLIHPIRAEQASAPRELPRPGWPGVTAPAARPARH